MSIINNALSGAVAAQMAMNTTSQNVANEDTTGYSQQQVVLGAVQLVQGGTLNPGNGVVVQSVQRVSDQYQVQALWSSNSALGGQNAMQPYFTQLQQVMGDDSSGISGGLDSFFSALNAVSSDPTSIPLRQQVIAAASGLASNFNSSMQLLETQDSDVQQQRGSMVQQINSLTSAVAQLNTQIQDAQASGSSDSGLLDSRDQDVQQLANLVGVQVLSQPNGTYSISLDSGQPLVIGNQAGTMGVTNNANGSQSVTIQFGQQSFAVDDTTSGGQLGGLGQYETGTLVPMEQAISSLAQQLTTNVNNTLAAGYDLNGNGGQPLFQYTASGNTSTVSVNPNTSADELGFSDSATTPGDSTNLQALVGLQNQSLTVPTVGSAQIGEVMTELIGNLGTQAQENTNAQSTAQTVRNNAESNWQSTSGVNSDQEAANLMQYQNMYQANMKVISVADTLFQSVLGIFGSSVG